MWIAGLTASVGRVAHLAVHRIMSTPTQPVRMQQDSARGHQTLAGAAEALVRPVCVVAVPGVGPVVSCKSHLLDVVIGFDRCSRHVYHLMGTWRFRCDLRRRFVSNFSGASFHQPLMKIL